MKDGKDGAGGKLAAADANATAALDIARADHAKILLASDTTTDEGDDADSDPKADAVSADRDAQRAKNQVDAAKAGDEVKPADETKRDEEPIKVDSPDAAKLDELTPEQRQEAIDRQSDAGVDQPEPAPVPEDADEQARADHDKQVQAQRDAEAKANEEYYNQQGNNVYVDPATGTVYQATYVDGQVVKTRQNEQVPVGEATGSRDVTITEPDAGGQTVTTELQPPVTEGDPAPAPVKTEVKTAPDGEVERAWVDGAGDDATKLDAALTQEQKDTLAEQQPSDTANKDERSAWYDQVNVNVAPDGKVSGAGLNHGTGELTLTRKNDKVETAPGVFASRDTSTKVDVAGTRALTGTTTKLDPNGAKTGDPIRDEVTTQVDGTITQSKVTVLGEDGQPKKDDKGNPVPPSAEQLDTTVAPETRAAIEESQRQHTAKIDELRGELPNPSTEEQRKEYVDRIAQNDAAIQAELARYYGSTNLYVLPTTGEVYNATYDDKTGEVHLQRPGLRTDFQGGATENHQFHIEPNGARREVRGIQVDAEDGKPAPAPIEFSTERTFSGEMKGTHLTQADANGVQQKLNDGAMLDELVTPDLKQELVATQQRDDQAIEALRETAEGTGPEAEAARNRMKQLMDERGVQVDLDGSVYSAKWVPTQNRADGNDFLTSELAVSRRDRPTPQDGQPATTVDTNATFHRDGSRRTETLLSTIPTGAPGEVVQTHQEIVNTDPAFQITSSQVVEGQTKKNPDGTTAVDESTTDFNAEGMPEQTVRRTGTRDGEGATDSRGFLISQDRSENKVTYSADGAPSVAEGTTWYGQADPEKDPAKVDTTKTTFWPGTDVPQQTDLTSTTTTKPENDDDDPIVDTTKTSTEFADTGIPTQTFTARTHSDPEHEFDLPQRELTVWNEDGTPKTRVAGGPVTSQFDLEEHAKNPDTANLLQGDELGSLGNRDVRTIDPNTPIPDGHGTPNQWTRGDDGRWDPANPQPQLAPPLKSSIDSKSAFDMPQQLKAASVASTLDANGPKPGTAEFDQLVAQQGDYESRMDAAPDDATRARIQREYFESHPYWVEQADDGAAPVLMAAAYTQGVPNSTMWGSERQKQPHAVLARSGIQGTTEDGASTLTDYQARLYQDNTRDDIYKTTTTAQGTPPTTQVVNEHRDTAGLLERRQSTTEGSQSRAAEGKQPIEFKTVVDEEFDTALVDPETGEPTLRTRREANAQWDNQTTSLTERSDELSGGNLVDTKITETTQSRDYDQGVVDEFLKGQHLAMYDASHGNFNTGDHTDMKTPPAGSFSTTRTTDVDYDAAGVAVYSESNQKDVNVQPRSNDDGTADENGVLLVSSEQTSKYGTKGGTAPIFDDEGMPIVDGTFEKTLKTSEFDPDEGAAGGNKDKDFQYRHQTEVSSSGGLAPDGTPTNVKWTPTLDETVQEGHDDDSIYVRNLYATDPATGQLLVSDKGQPVELRYGSEVYDRHGNKHVIGQTDGNPIDIPLGSNPDNFAWKDPMPQGPGGIPSTFGSSEHKDQDFADDAEDFYEAVGSKAVLVGGIALAVGGVVAAPFSGGLSLGLTVAGIGLAATDFGFQALNYRQGDIDGGDLAWSGAGLGLSIIPGAKLVTAGANSAKAGQAVLRGGVAATSTSRAATSTLGRAGTRAGQAVDDAINPRLTRAYSAHPGLTDTLARADKYLPNWAMGNTGQLLTNSPLIINGGLQLKESVARDGWTTDNILAATSVALGVGAPAVSAGHLRLYRNPTSTSTRQGLPSGADQLPATRNPRVTGTDDPNVFAPGRGPDLSPAPVGPDGVPLVTEAAPPRDTGAGTDGNGGQPAPQRPAPSTDEPAVAGTRGEGSDASAPASRATSTPEHTATPATRATPQHASELQQSVLPRLASGNNDVAARTFTGPDGVARVAIADRSTNQIYVLRDGALERVVTFDSADGASIAAATRTGQALPAAQVRELTSTPPRLALEAAPVGRTNNPDTQTTTEPTSTAHAVADVDPVAPRATFVEAAPRATTADGLSGYAVENGRPRFVELHRDANGGGAYLLDRSTGLRSPATPEALQSLKVDHRSALATGARISVEVDGRPVPGSVVEHRQDGTTVVRDDAGVHRSVGTDDLYDQNLGALLAGRTFIARASALDTSVALPTGTRIRQFTDAMAARHGITNEQLTIVGHDADGNILASNAAGEVQTLLPDPVLGANLDIALAGRSIVAADGSTMHVVGGDGTHVDVQVVRNGITRNERMTTQQLLERAPSLRQSAVREVEVLGHDGRSIRVRDMVNGSAREYDIPARDIGRLVPDHAAQMLPSRVRYDNQTAIIGVRGLDGRAVPPTAIADARFGSANVRRRFDASASDLLPNPNARIAPTVDEFGNVRAGIDPSYRVPRGGRVDEMPAPGTIKQGDLGDCFLLAALNEHIARNPEAAHNMVTVRADGNIAVRLGGRTVVVTPELPHVGRNLAFAQGTDQRMLMAAYVEKAIAATSPAGYQALQGGHPNIATAFLRGENPTFATAPSHADFARSFAAELTSPTSFEHTVGTFGAFGVHPSQVTPAGRARIAEVQKLDLVPGHAYSVEGTFRDGAGTTWVRLNNPWGHEHKIVRMDDLARVASTYSSGSRAIGSPDANSIVSTGQAANGASNSTAGFRMQPATTRTATTTSPW